MKHVSHLFFNIYILIACVSYTHITAEPPRYSANTYFNMAERDKNQGNLQDALRNYRNAINVNPNHFEALFYLANELFKMGDFSQAAELYQKAARLKKDQPEGIPPLYNLSFALHVQHHNEQALPLLQEVIERQPQHTRARILRATILQHNNELDKAYHEFTTILTYDPANYDALLGCARIYRDHNKHQEAIDCYHKAIESNPTALHSYFELAFMYHHMGNLERSYEYYTKTLALDPSCRDALINSAHVLRAMGRMSEAEQCYRKIVASTPHDAHAHYGLAESLLSQGKMLEGFKEFEWRWKRDADTRGFGHNLWDGSDLHGKKILLRAEYGQGDTIQFIRFAKLLKQRGATVLLEAQHSLVMLLSQCSYIDHVIPVDYPLPEYDVQLPIMSLAHRCGTTLETIPQSIPYIDVNPELVASWGEKLAHDHNFKIGICWDASPYYDSFHNHLSKKSIPLHFFQALSRIPKVSLYSLQRMNGTEQLAHLPEGMTVHAFDDSFDMEHGRFVDTAAVMHHLDLVITVDTSVAHIAGALGVPVWVILPHVADWRWMHDREDSPWYPTMRLFRQQIIGDWELLLEEVAHEAMKYMKTCKSASDMITAEISVGELIDKITILEIKQEQIQNPAKLTNILNELRTLNATRALTVPRTPRINLLSKELKTVNEQLWDIEDAIREKEFARCFDAEFIELARSVYITNDLRCKIKRQINDELGSRLVEEKSYKEYQHSPQA